MPCPYECKGWRFRFAGPPPQIQHQHQLQR
jgi:hypothetical protein